MSDTSRIYTQLEDIAKEAKRKGATDSRVIMKKTKSMSAEILNGNPVELQNSNNSIIQLDVFIGQKAATTIIESLRDENITAAIAGAIESAKLSSDNPFAGLADQSLLTTTKPDADIYDAAVPTVEELFERAREVEEAGMQEKRIKQSDGASAGRNESHLFILNSNGFHGDYARTSSYASIVLLAESKGRMERDYSGDSAVYAADLKDTSEIGQEAAKRVLQRLDARKVKSGQFPVIFDKRISGRLVSEFANAVSGHTVAKGMSFLKDSFGKQVMPKGMNVIDDPLIKRGLGSRPFDGNGLPSKRVELVKDGELQSWIVDLESARQLSVDIRNHAAGTSNLFIENGTETPEALMSDITEGFLVTGLMGHGGDTLTGNFSFGASGLWIKNGKPAFAVSEVTISGDMKDMFLNMRAANDMDMKKPSAPTMRIEGMTIGGN